ncbi:S-adenosyl-L-methionine-dependent methyltransferase [Astrocystis sublimbata]|nr:S-adenosyl-L-methionine-dependent methyltransferase [Astrocystis sublimbata]
MSQVNVQDLIQLLESFPRPQSRSDRNQLRDAMHKFSTKIQDEDVLQHEILSAPLRLVIPRVASDLQVFEILMKNKVPMSIDDLAKQTNSSRELLARILRYLASQDFIGCTPAQTWHASALTPFFANHGYAAGLRFGTECVLPSAKGLPTLLADNSFKDMSSMTTTAFQIGNSTSETMYEWLASHPEVKVDFQTWMTESQRHQGPIFSILPLDEFINEPSDVETPMFVDVGGGDGQVCAEIRRKYPHWKGKVINQDLQATLMKIGSFPDTVDHQDYDFFQEQPVKAAKIYYMRNILHNWPEDKCIEILVRIRQAMDTESVAIIDGSSISDTNPSWYESYVDVVMGMFFGARLKTLDEYKAMAARAGLEWERSLRYGNGSSQHIMVLTKMSE